MQLAAIDACHEQVGNKQQEQQQKETTTKATTTTTTTTTVNSQSFERIAIITIGDCELLVLRRVHGARCSIQLDEGSDGHGED